MDANEAQTVELFQQKMRQVVVVATARVVAKALQQHLECGAFKQVFAGVQLKSHIAIGVVKRVRNWPPAFGQFIKCSLNQARAPLRPRVQKRPRKRT